MKQIYFQSSLPRAGSTLLQNIMGQNPDFYVTPTSGVLELLYASRGNYSNSPEFKAQDQELMQNGFLNFCYNGLLGFYEGITDKPYVLDKSRGWGIHYNFLNSFYPEPKIVCLIRDLRDVFASMEKNFRKNQDKDAGIVNHANMTGTTTEKRIDVWANSQPIGLAIERLQQVCLEGIDQKMLIIKYEDLTNAPEKEMKKVYSFFNLNYYEHDFDNVEQITKEDDSVYGIYGNHIIKNKVEFIKSNAIDILGRKNCDNIKNHYDWFYRKFNYK